MQQHYNFFIFTFITNSINLSVPALKNFFFASISIVTFSLSTATQSPSDSQTLSEFSQPIVTQHNFFQAPIAFKKKEFVPIIHYQESCLNTPTNKLKDLFQKIIPSEQTYTQAIVLGTALGSFNTLSCYFLERQLPLWWPLNVVIARISCSLFLPSLVYVSLAFAERHGITCHSSTMHTCALISDWITYLAIKKYY